MKVKMKLEVEVDDVDVLAIEAIARKRRITVSAVVCDLLSNALQRIDPREFEPSPDEAFSITDDELVDEFAITCVLVADKF